MKTFFKVRGLKCKRKQSTEHLFLREIFQKQNNSCISCCCLLHRKKPLFYKPDHFAFGEGKSGTGKLPVEGTAATFPCLQPIPVAPTAGN